jgi:hypothetical protein
MMKLYIKVVLRCMDCPNMITSQVLHATYLCPNNNLKKIPDIGSVPKWCKLTDCGEKK